MKQATNYEKDAIGRRNVISCLPKILTLVGFDKNKSICKSYAENDYSSEEVELVSYGNECENDFSKNIFWPEFINTDEQEFGFCAVYKDSANNLYNLLVDAIAREYPLKNGKPPIAMQDNNKVYFASYDSMFIIPTCLAK